jgi:hypothetical protein
MRSHRLALTAFLLTGTVLLGGCGSGRQTATYDTGAAEQAEATAGAPSSPVVIAAPKGPLVAARDAAAADAAASRKAAAEADAKRKAARKELRKERAEAKRAAVREMLLRGALAAKSKAKDDGAQDATPAPKVDGTAPIGASDVAGSDLATERDRRSDAEARAAVVRFHELLDASDARACDLMTPRLLAEVHGNSPGALDRCRAAVSANTAPVSVVIAESRAHGKRASVAVVSHLGEAQATQTMYLVLVDGTWLIDLVVRKSAS